MNTDGRRPGKRSATAPSGNAKFLYYYYFEGSFIRRASGLLHLLTDLQTLCREAAWLGRTPVFPVIAPLNADHNFFIRPFSPLSKYWDVKRIDVRYFKDAGAPPLEMPLSSISDAQLRGMDIPPRKILKISADAPITAAQNRRFDLIARKMRLQPILHQDQRAPLPAESFAHGPRPAENLSREKEQEVLRVALHPSREASALAQKVIQRLPPDYCVIHARRGDMLNLPAFRTWTSPAAVLQVLEKAGVAADAPVYLMSDERSRRWLRRMRKRRPILHHTDFPHLKALIQPPGAVDNYFLFAVEQEIFQRAAKKLSFRRRGLSEEQSKSEYLIPHDAPLPIFWEYYHPAETRLSTAASGWTRNLRSLVSPEEKMKRLSLSVALLMRGLIYYCARRLLAPGSLRRFCSKRKALNIP